MSTYIINKGIGRTVEFKGLKAQYLFIFAGGLLGLLILVMILYMLGSGMYLCLAVGVAMGSLLVWQTFSLNSRYGQHGLMKAYARSKHPRYIIARRQLRRFVPLRYKTKHP